MKVGVVGLGYWGPNLVRNFLADKEIEKVLGYDKDRDRMISVRSKLPGLKLVKSFESMLDADIDAVVIATPVKTHYRFAKKALESGKHIWVEKPFTENSLQAEELLQCADKNHLKIFVDHTFLYTGAVRKMREYVDNNELGEIIYFDSVRINLGLFQHDVNVIWDLVPHDLAIMNYVIKDKYPISLIASGVANYYNYENIAHISINFENNSCFAHFHVNWTSPVKIRKIILAGTKKMLVFDDMENSEKIKVYDCGVEMLSNKENIRKALVQYRIGDMYSPKIIQTEAIALGVREFIESVKENRTPLTSGKDGLEVIRLLEAASLSIKNRGQLVELNGKRKMEAEKTLYVEDSINNKLEMHRNGY